MLRCAVLLLTLYLIVAQSATQPSPCQTLGLSSTYDVIVVGSGPGGSVAARRLAERNPGWKILAIERGESWSECPLCHSGSFADAGVAQADPNTGQELTTPPVPGMGNQSIMFKDPAVQGGGSSVNGADWTRGDLDYYFDNFWPASWNWDVMSFFAEYVETYTFPPNFYPAPFLYFPNVRGRYGPVHITQEEEYQQYFNDVKAIFPNISPASNRTSLNDGPKPGRGAAPNERTVYADGQRCSAYTAYIQGYTGTNLRVVTHTRANKVLFSGTKVTGVQIVTVNVTTQMAMSATCNVNAANVIISAGAIGTPKLLKLSGIGPKAELQALGIPVISNLPDVGANLDDHVTMLALLNNTSPNPLGLNGIVLWNGADSPTAEPNFQIEPMYPAGGVNYYGLSVPHYLHATGTVKLNSTNPDIPPIVQPNYFGNATDKQVFAPAFNKSLALFKLAGYKLTFDPCATASCATPLAQLQAYINAHLYFPGYHFSATAAICKVVNSLDMSVKGVSGLYILDASVFPRTGGGNTQMATYTVAERGVLEIEASILFPGLLGSVTDC